MSPGINVYFRNGGDLKIKDYLFGSGYKEINSDSITALLSGNIDPNMVIVFATDYFPKGDHTEWREIVIEKIFRCRRQGCVDRY